MKYIIITTLLFLTSCGTQKPFIKDNEYYSFPNNIPPAPDVYIFQ